MTQALPHCHLIGHTLTLYIDAARLPPPLSVKTHYAYLYTGGRWPSTASYFTIWQGTQGHFIYSLWIIHCFHYLGAHTITTNIFFFFFNSLPIPALLHPPLFGMACTASFHTALLSRPLSEKAYSLYSVSVNAAYRSSTASSSTILQGALHQRIYS